MPDTRLKLILEGQNRQLVQTLQDTRDQFQETQDSVESFQGAIDEYSEAMSKAGEAGTDVNDNIKLLGELLSTAASFSDKFAKGIETTFDNAISKLLGLQSASQEAAKAAEILAKKQAAAAAAGEIVEATSLWKTYGVQIQKTIPFVAGVALEIDRLDAAFQSLISLDPVGVFTNLGTAAVEGAHKVLELSSALYSGATIGIKAIANFVTSGNEALLDLGETVRGVLESFEGFGDSIAGDAFVAAASEFESFRAQLVAFSKDTKAAQQELEYLSEFAATTPFDLPGLVEADIQLKSFGVNAREYLATAANLAAVSGRTVSDAATAMGKALSGIPEGLNQIQESFRITKKDLLSAGAAFDRHGQIVARTIGEQKQLGEAIKRVSQIKLGDQISKAAETLEGRLSNLRDAVTRFRAEIGAKTLPHIKEFVSALTRIVESGNKLIPFFRIVAGYITQFTASLGHAGLVIAEFAASASEVLADKLLPAAKEAENVVGALASTASAAAPVLVTLGKGAAVLGAGLAATATAVTAGSIAFALYGAAGLAAVAALGPLALVIGLVATVAAKAAGSIIDMAKKGETTAGIMVGLVGVLGPVAIAIAAVTAKSALLATGINFLGTGLAALAGKAGFTGVATAITRGTASMASFVTAQAAAAGAVVGVAAAIAGLVVVASLLSKQLIDNAKAEDEYNTQQDYYLRKAAQVKDVRGKTIAQLAEEGRSVDDLRAWHRGLLEQIETLANENDPGSKARREELLKEADQVRKNIRGLIDYYEQSGKLQESALTQAARVSKEIIEFEEDRQNGLFENLREEKTAFDRHYSDLLDSKKRLEDEVTKLEKDQEERRKANRTDTVADDRLDAVKKQLGEQQQLVERFNNQAIQIRKAGIQDEKRRLEESLAHRLAIGKIGLAEYQKQIANELNFLQIKIDTEKAAAEASLKQQLKDGKILPEVYRKQYEEIQKTFKISADERLAHERQVEQTAVQTARTINDANLEARGTIISKLDREIQLTQLAHARGQDNVKTTAHLKDLINQRYEAEKKQLIDAHALEVSRNKGSVTAAADEIKFKEQLAALDFGHAQQLKSAGENQLATRAKEIQVAIQLAEAEKQVLEAKLASLDVKRGRGENVADEEKKLQAQINKITLNNLELRKNADLKNASLTAGERKVIEEQSKADTESAKQAQTLQTSQFEIDEARRVAAQKQEVEDALNQYRAAQFSELQRQLAQGDESAGVRLKALQEEISASETAQIKSQQKLSLLGVTDANRIAEIKKSFANRLNAQEIANINARRDREIQAAEAIAAFKQRSLDNEKGALELKRIKFEEDSAARLYQSDVARNRERLQSVSLAAEEFEITRQQLETEQAREIAALGAGASTKSINQIKLKYSIDIEKSNRQLHKTVKDINGEYIRGNQLLDTQLKKLDKELAKLGIIQDELSQLRDEDLRAQIARERGKSEESSSDAYERQRRIKELEKEASKQKDVTDKAFKHQAEINDAKTKADTAAAQAEATRREKKKQEDIKALKEAGKTKEEIERNIENRYGKGAVDKDISVLPGAEKGPIKLKNQAGTTGPVEEVKGTGGGGIGAELPALIAQLVQLQTATVVELQKQTALYNAPPAPPWSREESGTPWRTNSA